MKKVLVIQTAFIGDVILATSLLETLHKHSKEQLQIDLLVRKGNAKTITPRITWIKIKKKYGFLIDLFTYCFFMKSD